MAELKTQQTNDSVDDFLDSIKDETQREDSKKICALMQQIIGEEPKMWGSSIVGFGSRRITYASGRELDWMILAFSPRKQNLTLYVLDYSNDYDDLLKKLGKHTTGKSCLYIKRLADVNMDVLTEIIKKSANKNK